MKQDDSYILSNIRVRLEKIIQYPVFIGKHANYKGSAVLLDCYIEDAEFTIDYILIPNSRRGLGYTQKIVSYLKTILPKCGVRSIVVFPFPCDMIDSKKQTYSAINKLVKFYSKMGFNLENERDFRGCFMTDSGRINYTRKVYYDDLFGCNCMTINFK